MGRTWPDWIGAVQKHLTVRWLGKYPKKAKKESSKCDDCGADYVFLKCGTLAAAREMVEAGPDAVRRELERRECGPPEFPYVIFTNRQRELVYAN